MNRRNNEYAPVSMKNSSKVSTVDNDLELEPLENRKAFGEDSKQNGFNSKYGELKLKQRNFNVCTV